jgi:2-haloacid dehalogenase
MPISTEPALDALIFDAYGTLFDVQALAVLAESLAPRHGVDLARRWRTKQLEYTWLQSLMAGPGRPRDDFESITALALDYAAAELVLGLGAAEKQLLCDAWRTLPPFADARDALEAIAPMPCWILSNGTLAMLEPLVRHAQFQPLLQGIMSVDDVDIYKPAPQVYALAVERLGLPAACIGFVSANCWDAIGARAFGFRTYWINRFEATLDRHGPPPDHTIGALTELPSLLGR